MKIIISIGINALILFLMTYLLGENLEKGISAGIIVEGGWKTYLIGGIVLGFLNITIRPILKIISLPFFFFFYALGVFLVNGVVLKIFDYIVNNILIIPGVGYSIQGMENFVIAVAIFTILNIVSQLLLFKK